MTGRRSDIAYSGAQGVIEPVAVPAGGVPCPPWLRELAGRMPDIEPERFSRLLPPEEGGRESAVLILFGPAPADAQALTPGSQVAGEHVVLVERSHVMRSHPAQIAFPGGARDADDADLVATALREAQEETGLEPAGVEVLTELPSLFLPPSRFVVTPVLGWWPHPSALSVRDPAEVHDVISVPVSHLLDPGHRFTVTHPSGFVGPAFDLDDLLLWGFTAGLLSRVLEFGGLDQEWDASIERPIPDRYLQGERS